MDYWHGFGTDLNVSQIYETTIADRNSDLSSHFVVVPARSLGGGSYLFRGSQGLPETLGLWRLADIPGGRVVHSLAACLTSKDVEDFTGRFRGLFDEEGRHDSVELPAHFAFAEYLTFARAVPFEWSSPLSADSLGNILTARGRGESGYMYYEGTNALVLFVAIREGIVICGSSQKLIEALEGGLRRRILEFAKDCSSGEERAGDQEQS
jgi:hypothetical protein